LKRLLGRKKGTFIVLSALLIWLSTPGWADTFGERPPIYGPYTLGAWEWWVGGGMGLYLGPFTYSSSELHIGLGLTNSLQLELFFAHRLREQENYVGSSTLGLSTKLRFPIDERADLSLSTLVSLEGHDYGSFVSFGGELNGAWHLRPLLLHGGMCFRFTQGGLSAAEGCIGGGIDLLPNLRWLLEVSYQFPRDALAGAVKAWYRPVRFLDLNGSLHFPQPAISAELHLRF